MQHFNSLRLRCAAILFFILARGMSLHSQTTFHAFVGGNNSGPTLFTNPGNWISGSIAPSGSTNSVVGIYNQCNLDIDFTNNASGAFNSSFDLIAGSSLTVNSGITLQNNGVIGHTGFQLTNLGTLKSGTINGSGFVVNNGTIMPQSSSSNTIGTMTIGGSFQQGAAGNLALDVNGIGAGQHDKLVIAGNATLGGTITLTGTIPNLNDEIEIMTFSARTGTFSGITGPGGVWSLVYTPNSVRAKYNGQWYTFTGAGGTGWWSDPANWVGSAVPSGIVNDSVSITANCVMDIAIVMNHSLRTEVGTTLTVNQPLTINPLKRFYSNGALAVQSNLTMAGTMNLHANTTFSGGVHNLSGTVNVLGGEFSATNGNFIQLGNFNVTTTSVTTAFTACTVDITGTFTNSHATTTTEFGNCTITVSGTLNHSGISLVMNGGGVRALTVLPMGQINTSAGVTSITGFSTHSFAGTFNNTGTAQLVFNMPINLAGIFNNSAITYFNNPVVNTGTINNQNGGTLNLAMVPNPFPIFENIGAINNALGGQININGSSDLFGAGSFTNAGQVLIGSIAKLSFSGTAENTGTITNQGNLFVNGSGVFTNNGLVIDNNYFGNLGLINGTGTFQGDYWQNQGTIVPGNSIGTILMDNNLFVQSQTLNIEINTINNTNDSVKVTGNLFVEGTLNVTIADGLSPLTCAEYTIMTCASRTGTFSTINWPATTIASDWTIIYTPTKIKIRYGYEPTLRVFTGTSTDDYWMNHDNWLNCVAFSTVNVTSHIISDCVLDADITNNATVANAPGTTLSMNGRMLTNNPVSTVSIDGILDQSTGSFVQNGTYIGYGTYIGNLVNNGTLRPGIPGNPMELQGMFSPTSNSIVDIQITGPGLHSQLDITGTAALSGTLQVMLVGGYVPTTCTEFVLMTYSGGYSGQFSSFTAPGLSTDWELVYEANQLKLKYVAATMRTFVGTVNSDWHNAANWLECSAPNGQVNQPVIIAADCNLSTTVAMNANLTINSGKKLTVLSTSILNVSAGHALINNGILENSGTVVVTGSMNFSPTTNYINYGNLTYINTAHNLDLIGSITNTGALWLQTNSAYILTPINSTGAGSFRLDVETLISHTQAVSITAEDGNIEWNANQQVAAAVYSGIRINNSAVTTSGAGSIIMRARSGLGDNFDITAFQLQGNDARLETTGTGSISITGNGGSSSYSVGPAYGVFIGNNALVRTASGDVNVTAYGPNNPTQRSIAFLLSIANIETNGAGNIYIEGSNESNGSYSQGCVFENAGRVTTVNGNISISGEGGTGFNSENCGVLMSNAGGSGTSYLRSSGSGHISITGSGGYSDLQNNHGVLINGQSGAGRMVETNTGHINIFGYGGSGAGDSDGFRMIGSSIGTDLNVSGSGDLYISATGGLGGNGNNGVQYTGKITTNTGNIEIFATGDDGNSAGISHENSELYSNTGFIYVEAFRSGNEPAFNGGFTGKFGKSTATGLITLVGDSFEGSIVETTGPAVIRPYTTERSIGIGSNAMGDLHFSDSELSNFYTSSLTIGDAANGTGLVSVNQSGSILSDFHIVGGTIEVGNVQAQYNGNRKDVRLTARTGDVKGIVGSSNSGVQCDMLEVSTPNGMLRPGNSPGLFQVNGHYVHTGNLEIEIAGTNGPGNPTGHDQMRVLGSPSSIVLGGTLTVHLLNGFVPTAGQSFVIVDATGSTNLIAGTFVNIVTPDYQWNVIYSTTQVVLQAVGVLPVELIDFSAKNEEKTVLLHWQTATEVNADYFEVEHSTDGARFESIGMVKATGNSTTLQRYQLRHEQPAAGLNYYRLRQVDLDGGVELSHIVLVDRGVDAGIRVFPNPVSAHSAAVETLHCNVSTTTATAAQIFDATGRLVYLIPIEEGNNVLNISGLSAGLYLVRVGEWTERLVIME
jgi:Secretion system C-terminal sorting domain